MVRVRDETMPYVSAVAAETALREKEEELANLRAELAATIRPTRASSSAESFDMFQK